MSSGRHEQTVVLLRAAQGGDAAALNELFERYRDRVQQIVSLLFGKRRTDLLELEEDIVQETLLDALRDLSAFEPETEGAFLHWLSKLALNNIRDATRRGQTLKRGSGRVRSMSALPTGFLVDSVFAALGPTPSQVLASKELSDQIEKALLTLNERQRRAFVLRNMCEAPYEVLVSELGLQGTSSARSLYSRALAELSSQLPDPRG